MNYDLGQEWTKKNGTLSDKTACKEFGFAMQDIIKAINDGKLQFREGNIYGNPYFRLLRSEVEKLAIEMFGICSFGKKKANAELRKINKELGELKARISELEKRKSELSVVIKA